MLVPSSLPKIGVDARGGLIESQKPMEIEEDEGSCSCRFEVGLRIELSEISELSGGWEEGV